MKNLLGLGFALMCASTSHAAAPPAPARAAPVAAPAARPWAAGVSQTDQDEAFRIFKEGNTLFAESQHAKALAKYREALKKWDHPAIRYNTAVSLINLDQPLAAYENLVFALKYGDAPLGAETFTQGTLYKKLLSGQIAEIEVACDDAGTQIVLDGEPLFVAPGRAKRRLLPGAHQLVASNDGFLTDSRALQLPAGRVTEETIALKPLSSLPVNLVRRFAVWKPWAVLAAGTAVALIGIPLMLDTKSNYDTYDSEVARECPNGCVASKVPPTATSAYNRARGENDAAVALFVTGGAVAAAGVVLLILNQPHAEAPQLMVTPVVTGKTAGFSAQLTF